VLSLPEVDWQQRMGLDQLIVLDAVILIIVENMLWHYITI